MERRITLNKLLSYVASITTANDNDDDAKDNYEISAFKNDLVESVFKILKFGEVNSLGDLPKKLKKIFDPFISDMKRVGVLPNKNKTINVSLLYSILYCVKPDFLDMSNAEKITCIEQLTKKMVSDLYSRKLFEEFEYKKLGWTKKELDETLVKYKNNILTLRFLSDYLHISIFLFNANEDKIYAIYPEENYNIFKPSVFLSFFDGIFEPIVYKTDKIWRNEHDPLKKLINVDKKYIGLLDVNFSKKSADYQEKEFTIGSNDLTKYLPDEDDEKEKDKDEEKADNDYDEVYVKHPDTEVYIDDPEDTDVDIGTVKDNEDIFCTKTDNDDSASDLIQTISLKMKIEDLQKIAKGFDISSDKGKFKNGNPKMKTKTELYNELLSKIKNN